MTEKMQKLEKADGQSMDIVENNIEQLKELFPEVFAEGKINFDRLQEVLGNYVVTDEDHYNFTWHGKREAARLALSPSTGTLRPYPQESVDWDKTQNLFIEGDNLEVLKLLQKSYHRQIKMIYIDPPYNTGNDFVYKDDFRDGVKNYLEITGQLNSDGKKIGTNTSSTGRYHTNWLNMMYPRLRLARNLLKEDGVILISIDDNEQANLKQICDEIFGEENRLSTQHIQVRYANKTLNEKNDWQPVMEYVYVYAKNASVFKPKKESDEYSVEKFRFEFKELSAGQEIDVKGRKVTVFRSGEWEVIEHEKPSTNLLKETWVSGSIYSGTGNGQMVQRVIEPRITIDGYGSLYKIDGLGEDGLGYRYFTGPRSEGSTRAKMFSGVPLVKIEEISNGTAVKYKSISNIRVFEDYAADFGNIANEGGVKYNSGKKPLKMLNELIEICNLSENDIVLDFFAGSATTAHAVMSSNAKDSGTRRFILVQLPETLSEDVYEQKDTYTFLTSINKPPVLTELGKERIRRSAKKIKEENPLFSGDLGFKVFKLDTSNIKTWDAGFDTLKDDLIAAADYIKQDRSSDDIVFELLLKYGLDLTVPIETRMIAGKKVYSIGMGALVVCLDNDVPMETVNGIGALKKELRPEIMRVVFKDSGFKDDVVKTNALQTLKRFGIEDIKSL